MKRRDLPDSYVTGNEPTLVTSRFETLAKVNVRNAHMRRSDVFVRHFHSGASLGREGLTPLNMGFPDRWVVRT